MIVQKKKNTENYHMLISFLHQTDKFIQKFWQWGDGINTKDDITPFDGIWFRIQVATSGRKRLQRIRTQNTNTI